MEVAGNPNQAHAAGQQTQTAAEAGNAVKSQFSAAAQACASAAKEASLPGAYTGYESHFVNRLVKIIQLAENAGINIQTGAAALVNTDNQTASGFQQSQAAIPPINRGAGGRRAY
ncbi:hypothetical protein [Fodinicola acaciae]|uniref:hypothetical protein n=1 Tax=Fodinicola acaciae TaxID=2681555 RepID=UPI0013D109C2|nr:hypothetical protein [Fodinicola acaciae]